MTDKVVILRTAWSKNFWEKERQAPFPHIEYDRSKWNELSQNCPLPGLGVYIKQRIKNKEYDYRYKPFVYIRIEGINFDANNNQPVFSFTPISVSKKALSKDIEGKFPDLPLFSTVPSKDILSALQGLGETLPQEWMKLINSTGPIYSWRDYIGRYFLELIDTIVGNNEFEDRCFELLKAIGFSVKQMGHEIVGEYPDGEIFIDDDIVVVYDCKNREDFIPSVEDSRKLSKYVEDAKIKYKGKKVYGIFIAQTVDTAHLYSTQQSEFPVIQAQELLYVLYKKLYMGREFTLIPFRKILSRKYILNHTLIDNEWR